MTVGERIKHAREIKGVSQTELANTIKISKQNLYKYENNIITNIPSDKIEAIAIHLDISPAYLMGWEHIGNHTTSTIKLSKHEEDMIYAYRRQPEMQSAVDRLLGIAESEYVPVAVAARSETNRPVEFTYISKEKLEQLENAESAENEVDI